MSQDRDAPERMALKMLLRHSGWTEDLDLFQHMRNALLFQGEAGNARVDTSRKAEKNYRIRG